MQEVWFLMDDDFMHVLHSMVELKDDEFVFFLRFLTDSNDYPESKHSRCQPFYLYLK